MSSLYSCQITLVSTILELMTNSSISSTTNKASEIGLKEEEKEVTHFLEVDGHVFSRKRVKKLGPLALLEENGWGILDYLIFLS